MVCPVCNQIVSIYETALIVLVEDTQGIRANASIHMRCEDEFVETWEPLIEADATQ